ncbi:MAG: MerR family transcriptional regulator [Caulobacter sp.]|nr:MerR family transcriptional regulator [Caulobacter sp.]
MSSDQRYFSPSEAAARLGVSAKALRLYEQRGLITPLRTEAGWRAYGPDQMALAAEIAALRRLGLSLSQAGQVLRGDPADLEPVLAAHQGRLQGQMRQLGEAVERIRALRQDLSRGQAPALSDLTRLVAPAGAMALSIALPWPWGGERFELAPVPPLTWLTGPLGSGKTRLAVAIAEALPGAVFVGLDRDAAALDLASDPALSARVDQALAWLAGEGATLSDALTAIVGHLESDGPSVLVIDLIEQGLDMATQEALAAWLRTRAAPDRPVVAMTRSSAMLDLAAVGPDEALLFCPANHSPPMRVAPWPGSPGYEALESCLASPQVRARTEGVVVMRRGMA